MHFGDPARRWAALAFGGALAALLAHHPLAAQQPPAGRAEVTGRVTDARTGEPLVLVHVRGEGVQLDRTTDSAGIYHLPGVPSGPQVLRAQRIGYAPVRMAVTVPLSGVLVQDIAVAASALQLEGVVVTADVMGRAQGESRPELGTASVSGRQAMRTPLNQLTQGWTSLRPRPCLATASMKLSLPVPPMRVPKLLNSRFWLSL